MVVPTAHTTQQNYLIGLFPKMSISLVMMLMSITQSLYDSSQQAFHQKNQQEHDITLPKV